MYTYTQIKLEEIKCLLAFNYSLICLKTGHAPVMFAFIQPHRTL